MRIRLELIGPLRVHPGGREIESGVRKGSSVRSILKKVLGYSSRELEFVQVARAGKVLHLDSKIHSDATIQVILRLGGG